MLVAGLVAGGVCVSLIMSNDQPFYSGEFLP